MELKHLRTFLALSEIKNFTKTAESLHYAQSYVTTQIQQLEEELGVKLFERLGKSITLTSHGTDLVPYARQMTALIQEMKLGFSDHENSRLVIGAAESICTDKLPQILQAFQQQHPGVEFYLQVIDTDDFLPLLEQNLLDLAFVLDMPVRSPALTTAMQFAEPVCAFAAPDHPLARKQQVSVEDFAGLPVILTGKGCRYRSCFEQTLKQEAVTPKIVLETGSIQIMKQTAACGLGVCILPLAAVREELLTGKLVRLNHDTDYGISSQLIHHKDKWLSPALKHFIAAVQAAYSL